MKGDERKLAGSIDVSLLCPRHRRLLVPQPAQPGLLEKEHRMVGRGLWESVSCTLAAVLSAGPFVHLCHKYSLVLASPVQAIATQWCPKRSVAPAPGREHAVSWGADMSIT